MATDNIKPAKSALPQTGQAPKTTRRRKFRFTIDVALRREGMDESEYAKEFRRYFDIVTGKRENKGDSGEEIDLKVFFEILKEWVRHLVEGEDLAKSESSSEVPTIIQLRHNVPRPNRALPDKPTKTT